ncbi:MAG: 4-hydroxy-3-methylbut-2-en-1-yl diphosphate synthase, partial [Gemmatimonadaceae bacterium]|nr:4-hydroxy-3-methylbut-2-en-1-yl diphosphate synthase [Caulobacter sp.]
VYMAGKPNHKQSNDGMIDHIVELVEQRAAVLQAAADEAEAIAAE